MTKHFVLAICVVVAAAAAPALAQTTESGEAIIVDTPPVETQLPDGTVFTEVHNEQVLLASDASHPFHHVALVCHGSCRDTSCAGGCVGQDPDGDVITISWDGMNQGGWKLTGGTGKWSNASGSGTWKSKGPMGAGFTRNAWTGTITMQ